MKENIITLVLSIISAILFVLALIFKYYDFITLYIVLLIISIIIFVFLIYYNFIFIHRDKSKDKLKQILKKYDKVIVYVDEYKIKKNNIEVDSIEELYEISEKNNKPILYLEKDGKFIVDNKKEYIFKIK